jgi:hypothetical protein
MIRFRSIAAIVLLLTFSAVGFSQTIVRPIPQPAINTVSFTPANGTTTNQVYVTIKPLDRFGNGIVGACGQFWWADNLAGLGITATASSGTSGLTDVPDRAGFMLGTTAATPSVATSRISFGVCTDSTGTVKVAVVDSAKTLYVPTFQSYDGRIFVGPKLATANYK